MIITWAMALIDASCTVTVISDVADARRCQRPYLLLVAAGTHRAIEVRAPSTDHRRSSRVLSQTARDW